MEKVTHEDNIKQIIILGSAPRHEAIPRIINSEIWTISTGLPLRRVTRLFEIHDYMHDRYRRRILDANPDIVYMQYHWKPIPQSVPLPVNMLVARFGEHFNNCISYMLGMAIAEHEVEIATGERAGTILYLRRMHTMYSHEYVSQIPEICYYIGLARGIGMDVRISEYSVLLKPKRLYMFKDYEYGVTG